ncbi:hypothetical protein BSQ98_13190 [Serratia liquefaciens]|nr:hypothetical protein BSQ98_13190 [Serratia liquefaciens]
MHLYLITDNVFFDFKNDRLICTPKGKGTKNISCTYMRKTLSRLLTYLLANCEGDLIKIDDLLFNVWDTYGLQSSSARLCQVMHTLKINLNSLGVPVDFINRVNNNHYKVRNDIITRLYSTHD